MGYLDLIQQLDILFFQVCLKISNALYDAVSLSLEEATTYFFWDFQGKKKKELEVLDFSH